MSAEAVAASPAGPANAAAPNFPAPLAQAQGGRLPLIAWVPQVVLLLMAAATLLWVLWPGTRIFPPATASAIAPEVVDEASRAELDSLRARRTALQVALDGAQCRANGCLMLPGNLSLEGVTMPDAGKPALSRPAKVAPDAPIALAPDRVSVPRGDPAKGAGGRTADTSTLLAEVEASTVLVLASGPDRLRTGSGFVIAPGLIVTNRHVIEGAIPDKIFVTNASLGKAEPARVLKAEGPFEDTGRDFALLQTGPASLPALKLASPATSQKLHHVVATGFPGDVMESDVGFNRLLAGDATGIPDLAVVDGTVNADQDMPPDAEVLVHSAPLSSGNSGGPLVDFRGRVLGVNTFVKQGPMRTLNFAVSTATLATFLAGTPGEVPVDTSDCAPNVMPLPETLPAAPANAAPAPANAAPANANAANANVANAAAVPDPAAPDATATTAPDTAAPDKAAPDTAATNTVADQAKIDPDAAKAAPDPAKPAP